ncbi:MAG: hypothetical protein P8Z30_04210 [Acidobacteriota bacterium]
MQIDANPRLRGKRRLMLAGAGAAFVAGAFLIAHSLAVRHVTATTLHVAAFTLHTKTVTYQNTAEGQLLAETTVARLSDGTTVHYGAAGFPEISQGVTARTIDYPDGTRAIISDFAQVKTIVPGSPELASAIASRLMNPPANCVFPGYTLLGYGTILGQKVAKVRWPSLKGLKDETIQWLAPALGCVAMQTENLVPQPGGKLKVLSKMETVSLSVGPPDPHLFDPEPNYNVVKPSEAMRKVFEKAGWAWDSDAQAHAARADQRYSKAVQMAGR